MLVFSVFEMLFKVTNCILLGLVIQYFEMYGHLGPDASFSGFWQTRLGGSALSLLLSLSVLISALFHHQVYFGNIRVGMKIMALLTVAIHDKLGRLDVHYMSPGRIINLASNDIESFRTAFVLFHSLYIAPMEIFIVTYFLKEMIGWLPTFTGLLSLLVMIPIQGILAECIVYYRKQILERRDSLLRYINDTFLGIQVIKYYAWEDAFLQRISNERSALLKLFYSISWIRCFNESSAFFSGLMVSSVAYLTIYLQGEPLIPSKVFASLGLFFLVQVDITDLMPRAIEYITRSYVSVKRLESFLLLPERVPTAEACLRPEVVLSINHGTFYWPLYDEEIMESMGAEPQEQSAILEDINLEVFCGQFVMIIGPVGSGKSSLFSAILNQMPPVNPSLTRIFVRTPLAYASQQPWLFSGTVQDNILLGRSFDAKRMEKVISICCLQRDIALFPHGLASQVGERGHFLSGGQKARVSLARAFYDFDSTKLFLLDDVLAAIDNIVSKKILENILELIVETGSTVLFITHMTQFLPFSHRVIALNNGLIEFDGSFAEYKDKNLHVGDYEATIDSPFSGPSEDVSSSDSDSSSHDEESDDDILTPRIPYLSRSLETSPSMGNVHIDDERSIFARNVFKKPSSSAAKRSIPSHYTDYKAFPLGIQKPLTLNRGRIVFKPVTAKRRAHSVDPKAQPSPLSFRIKPSGPSGIEEERSVGAVSLATYREFLSISCCAGFFLLIMCILPQFLFILANQWLNLWSSQSFSDQQTQSIYPIMIVSLTVACTLTSLVRAESFFWVCMRGCQRIFDLMLQRSIHFPLSFFQAHPIGRILNRFTKDQSLVDEELPWTLFDAVQCLLMFFGSLLLVLYLNFWIILVLPPILYLYYMIRVWYLSASREIKRCEALARSPVMSLLNATLLGISTLHSYPSSIFASFHFQFKYAVLLYLLYICFTTFCRRYLQNQHTLALFAYDSAARWMAFWLDLVSVLFFFLLCQIFALLLFLKDSFPSLAPYMTFTAADAGLALSYSMYLLGLVQWCTRQLSEVENMMTSVERILSYSKLPVESQAGVDPNKGVLPSSSMEPLWPSHGAVHVKNLTLNVPSRSLPILSGISFTIPGGGYTVAVVGRTGAGKSSLLSAMLRLIEPTEDSLVTIDGVAIRDVSLDCLRRSISVIPQDPVLFDAPLRYNLDPYGKCSDFELWQALSMVSLYRPSHLYDAQSTEFVEDLDSSLFLPEGLDTDLTGSCLSVGEKQLLCLARAILRKTKIIFMDEATANIDIQTSAMIQNLLLTVFPKSTVFTIAHRLQTVIDYDYVLVLDRGKLVEEGSPYDLLKSLESSALDRDLDSIDEHELGYFAKMIFEMGRDQSMEMISRARSKHYTSSR